MARHTLISLSLSLSLSRSLDYTVTCLHRLNPHLTINKVHHLSLRHMDSNNLRNIIRIRSPKPASHLRPKAHPRTQRNTTIFPTMPKPHNTTKPASTLTLQPRHLPHQCPRTPANKARDLDLALAQVKAKA